MNINECLNVLCPNIRQEKCQEEEFFSSFLSISTRSSILNEIFCDNYFPVPKAYLNRN